MINNHDDTREKITLDELDQITQDKYYANKSKKHYYAFFKIRTVLTPLIKIQRALKPCEIVRNILDNKKNSDSANPFVVGLDVKSSVKYYLKELLKIGLVEKDENGYYRLTYRVIPPWPEKDVGFYLNPDKPDLAVVLPLLVIIRDSCDQLLEYFQEGGA